MRNSIIECKNTLSVVQSIAHQTFRGAEMLAAQRAFEGRLVALASAHNLLTQMNWEHSSLEQIARVVLNVTGDGPGRIRLSGPKILFLPAVAEKPLGLRVDQRDSAVLVGHHHTARRGFDREPESLFALA